MPASNSICRYLLRTTDTDAARVFYASILGHDRTPIVPLHEQAIARGARPHWLGQIEVEDVDASVTAFLEQGAQRLGPTVAFPDGRTLIRSSSAGARPSESRSPSTESSNTSRG